MAVYNHSGQRMANDAPTPTPTKTSKQQSAPHKKVFLNESGDLVREAREEYLCNSQCDPIILSSTSPVTVINDDFPDPPLWVKLEKSSPDDPEYKLILYQASKSSVPHKTSWLTNSEICAQQLLLKKEFLFLDGLNDPCCA